MAMAVPHLTCLMFLVRHTQHFFLKGKFVLIDSKLHNKALPNDTQAPATVFPPIPCDWCLYPLILCHLHPVPYYEDRPLLENRRLWPSQHFDPFQTSPSGMEVDSPSGMEFDSPSGMEVDFPSFFKKFFDGDEDVKSNICHGSGEASI